MVAGGPPKPASSRFDSDGSCRGKGKSAASAALARESCLAVWTPSKGRSSNWEDTGFARRKHGFEARSIHVVL